MGQFDSLVESASRRVWGEMGYPVYPAGMRRDGNAIHFGVIVVTPCGLTENVDVVVSTDYACYRFTSPSGVEDFASRLKDNVENLRDKKPHLFRVAQDREEDRPPKASTGLAVSVKVPGRISMSRGLARDLE